MTRTELRRAIDRAYVVFARYELHGKVDVCRCPACLETRAGQRLIDTPLREISAALLASYSHAAKPIDPTQLSQSLRYFLPRYFELIAAKDWPVHSFEAGALTMLGQARYRLTWPADEIDAVDDFFLALFRSTLSEPVELADEFGALNRDCEIAIVLGLVIGAGGDIGPLLAEWDETPSDLASFQLALLIEHSRTGLQKRGRLHWAYDDGNANAEKTMLDWLLRPAVRARMESAFLAETDPVKQAVFSNAETLLRRLADR